MARPIRSYKSGRCEIAVFGNDHGESFKLSKSFKDKEGNWQNSDFFFDSELGDLAALIDKARQERIRERQTGEQPGGQTDKKADDIPFGF